MDSSPQPSLNKTITSILIAGLALVSPGLAQNMGTLGLEDAIEMALSRNYTIQVQEFNPQIAAQNLRGQQGVFDPRLTAQISQFKQETDQGVDPITNLPLSSRVENESYEVAVSGVLPTGTRYNLGLDIGNNRALFNNFVDEYDSFGGLTLTQPILNGFGFAENLSGIRVARNNENISQWQFRLTLMETITDVIASYNALYFAEKNLEVAVNSRDLARQLLKENQRRVELGTMAEVDTLQAASQLALREERVLNANRLFQNQKIRFLALITDEVEPLLDLEVEISPPPQAAFLATEPKTDFQTALQKRPDYQQAILDLRNREVLLARDARRELPSLNLFGQLGYSGTNRDAGQSFDQIGTLDFETSSIGASLDYPLPNRTARATRVASRLSKNQAELQLRRLQQFILTQVDIAARRIQTDWERIEAARQAREISERALEGEEKRLELGTTSSFVVLRLQSDLAEAEVRELQAIVDYNQALADYDLQLGRTLETFNVTTAYD